MQIFPWNYLFCVFLLPQTSLGWHNTDLRRFSSFSGGFNYDRALSSRHPYSNSVQEAILFPTQNSQFESKLRRKQVGSIFSTTQLTAVTIDCSFAMGWADDHEANRFIANALGYLIGFGSLLLYTPIAIRLFRQKSADGTTLSTWMLKICSYTCSDIYGIVRKYPLSTYIDTLTITVEATIILGLVANYQKKWQETGLWAFMLSYFIVSSYLLLAAPSSMVAAGQLAAAFLNSAALIPQFVLNWRKQTKGDYSPSTAGLAAFGCAVRLFTVQELAGSDPILLGSFGLAFVLNSLLLCQIVYYGVVVEELSLGAVFAADWAKEAEANSSGSASFIEMQDEESENEQMSLVEDVEESLKIQ